MTGPTEFRKLHLLAWETTQACSLACPHCRASACPTRPAGELTTEEGKKLLREAARVGPGIVILSGGEPLLRDDLELLAAAAVANGQTPVVSTNDGAMLSSERIARLKAAGVTRFSFSIHGPTADFHDPFVGRIGAFSQACGAFERLAAAGVEFQINTTVMHANCERLAEMHAFAVGCKAVAWHLFFIVPMGRAAGNATGSMLDDQGVERVLEWVAGMADASPIPIKVTCAPQYARIRAKLGLKQAGHGRGCMAGDGFAFVSSRGDVKPCGYFERTVGNVRERAFDELYREAPLFTDLRNLERLEGRCGSCPYKRLCGGCRARALAMEGNHMAGDPTCTFDHPQS
ncbi:MAG TPA: radical SAM protein [Candidatus Ozemobacteraceae bacterium]|nr:radical SAM protein [Candidatus Ozemobacteraceae bacterium]